MKQQTAIALTKIKQNYRIPFELKYPVNRKYLAKAFLDSFLTVT